MLLMMPCMQQEPGPVDPRQSRKCLHYNPLLFAFAINYTVCIRKFILYQEMGVSYLAPRGSYVVQRTEIKSFHVEHTVASC